MIELYTAPNGWKVSICPEELALRYRVRYLADKAGRLLPADATRVKR